MTRPLLDFSLRCAAVVAGLLTNISAAAQPAVLLDPVRLRPVGLSEYASAGFSVALAGDYAFVGAPGDSVGPPRFPEFPTEPLNRSGSVYVFKKQSEYYVTDQRLIGRFEIVNREFEEFGWSMSAIDRQGMTGILIGSRRWTSSTSIGTGRAYFFIRDDSEGRWREAAALRPRILGSNEGVGSSVALVASRFGLVAILGAPGYQPRPDARERGRAYVFTQDPATGAWTEAAALENCFSPSQTEGGLIGEGVAAVTTSTGVVVALGGRQIISIADFNRSSSGCIYSRDDTGAVPGPWTLQASLMPDPPDQNGGVVVGVSAGTDATGRPTVAFGPLYGHYLMTYSREPGADTWRQTNALYTSFASSLGSSSAQGTIAGQSVLLAGAPYEQYFGDNSGAGFLYSRSPETAEYTLRAVLGSRENLNYANLGSATAVGTNGWVATATPAPRPPDFEGRTYLYDVRSLFPVAAEAPPLPDGARLAIAGANPARVIAQVTYSLIEGGPVEVAVFDALGREVLRPVSADRGPGEHRETIPVSGLARGVYLVRLATAGRRESVRLVVER